MRGMVWEKVPGWRLAGKVQSFLIDLWVLLTCAAYAKTQ